MCSVQRCNTRDVDIFYSLRKYLQAFRGSQPTKMKWIIQGRLELKSNDWQHMVFYRVDLCRFKLRIKSLWCRSIIQCVWRLRRCSKLVESGNISTSMINWLIQFTADTVNESPHYLFYMYGIHQIERNSTVWCTRWPAFCILHAYKIVRILAAPDSTNGKQWWTRFVFRNYEQNSTAIYYDRYTI